MTVMTAVNPNAWVDPNTIESKPWESQAGIIKLIEFPVKNDRMSRRDFHLYWTRHHSPHVMNLTAFSQYIRKYTVSLIDDGLSDLPDVYGLMNNFEGASELWLDSLEEIDKWFAQQEYEKIIADDEQRFLSSEGGAMIFAKEEKLHVKDPDLVETNRTRVFLILCAQDTYDYDFIHNAVSQFGRRLLENSPDVSDILRLSASHKIREPFPEGIPFADIDAVIEIMFDDSEAASDVLSSAPFLSRIKALKAEPWLDSLQTLSSQMLVIHDEYSFQPTTTQPMTFRQ